MHQQHPPNNSPPLSTTPTPVETVTATAVTDSTTDITVDVSISPAVLEYRRASTVIHLRVYDLSDVQVQGVAFTRQELLDGPAGVTILGSATLSLNPVDGAVVGVPHTFTGLDLLLTSYRVYAIRGDSFCDFPPAHDDVVQACPADFTTTLDSATAPLGIEVDASATVSAGFATSAVIISFSVYDADAIAGSTPTLDSALAGDIDGVAPVATVLDVVVDANVAASASFGPELLTPDTSYVVLVVAHTDDHECVGTLQSATVTTPACPSESDTVTAVAHEDGVTNSIKVEVAITPAVQEYRRPSSTVALRVYLRDDVTVQGASYTRQELLDGPTGITIAASADLSLNADGTVANLPREFADLLTSEWYRVYAIRTDAFCEQSSPSFADVLTNCDDSGTTLTPSRSCVLHSPHPLCALDTHIPQSHSSPKPTPTPLADLVSW